MRNEYDLVKNVGFQIQGTGEGFGKRYVMHDIVNPLITWYLV